MGTAKAWTTERRAKQREIIARTRPWEHATGPRTEAGKAVSSRNAYSGALEGGQLYMNVRLQMRARARCEAEWLLSLLSQTKV